MSNIELQNLQSQQEAEIMEESSNKLEIIYQHIESSISELKIKSE